MVCFCMRCMTRIEHHSSGNPVSDNHKERMLSRTDSFRALSRSGYRISRTTHDAPSLTFMMTALTGQRIFASILLYAA